MATAVEEMSATVLEVAKNSNDASTASKKAAGVAVEGGEVVRQTIDGMNRIAVIDDIADQTNLLDQVATAIEAARAGEQGLGFAVVADEVRKLAERTTKATKEIASMIKAIQNDTQCAVQSMATGSDEVQRGVQLANKAGSSLEEIVEVVGSVTALIQQIASAAEEQSVAAEEIRTSVEAVSSITKETSVGADQTASSTQELAILATDLQRLIQHFKL